ncbi:MAG: HAMP domain-containing histidine kinase [Fibrobacteres bacterium]|jgi:signal transduction histidine kinase|nr:HAMP domain-containing histidine kinase [Fibrobacterota bacterium]
MLFILLAAVIPLSILEFVLRAEALPEPIWLGDALAFALLTLATFFFLGAWVQRKRKTASRVPATGQDWEATLPCLVHEIRNYSSVIKGNALLLRSRMDGPEILGPLGRLERTTDKIAVLAQEILDAVSPTELGDRESLCLRAVLEHCIAEHFHEARDSFRIETTGTLPAVAGDPRKLERVFLNLFRNAREAEAKTVRIRIRSAFGRVRLWVEDDGHGCRPEALARFFQPLYSTKKTQGGTGLGLYMVKAILEAHGGRINALSKNGRTRHGTGMVFRLEFPIAAGSKAKTRMPGDFGNKSVPLEEAVG